MKNTKRYLSIFLALALAAPVFTGCDNGLDEYKSGETIAPPSDKFKAEIQFVSRLTDGALAGSDADYAAIDNYILTGEASEHDKAIIDRYHSRSEHKRRPAATYHAE